MFKIKSLNRPEKMYFYISVLVQFSCLFHKYIKCVYFCYFKSFLKFYFIVYTILTNSFGIRLGTISTIRSISFQKFINNYKSVLYVCFSQHNIFFSWCLIICDKRNKKEKSRVNPIF